MSENTGGAIPAGWYGDPANPAQLRWWDGTAWTAHVAPTPAPTPVAPPVVPPVVPPVAQASANQVLDASGRPYVPMQQVRSWEFAETAVSAAPSRWNTVSSWLLATSGLWATAIQLVMLVIFGALSNPTAPRTTTETLASYGATGVVVLLFLLLVFSDRSTLRSWGYPSVPHWAWIFLSPLGYLIARTVSLRSQVRRGAAPLVFYCVTLGVLLLSTIAAAVAIPIYLATNHGVFTSASANAQQLATGLQTGMDKNGGNYKVTCQPFVEPTGAAVREACSAVDASGTAHVLTIEIDPPSTPGGVPSVHLLSVTPPISG